MGLSGGHKFKENNVVGGEREEGYITRVIDKGEGNRDLGILIILGQLGLTFHGN